MSFSTTTHYVIEGDKAQIKELYDILYPAAERVQAVDDGWDRWDEANSAMVDVCKALGFPSVQDSCIGLSGVCLFSDCVLSFYVDNWKRYSRMQRYISYRYPEMTIYFHASVMYH